MNSPLWPARLDHITRGSDQPEQLVAFYCGALAMTADEIEPACWLLRGPQRRMLIRRGAHGAQPMHAFALQNSAQLNALRVHCEQRQLAPLPQSSPLFNDGFALTDPDDRTICFGLADKPARPAVQPGDDAAQLSGRLQHVVVATSHLPAMVAFYRDALGFAVSDNVFDGAPQDGDVTACFMRSDPEHHSFAAFKAPQPRPDHVCFEAKDWNAIRDWADHMSAAHIKLWWGPGRHGPGNNLFFMIEDPEGYKLEISAELEHLPQALPARAWTHEERTLNLWGSAWMRS